MDSNAEQKLCALADLPDGESRGLLSDGMGMASKLCVVRQGSEVFAWLNDCPHEHRPMEYRRDRFLSPDRHHIVCYAHSAHFDIRSGHCFAGPCEGKSLTPVPVRIEDGYVWIPGELPTVFD
jgi:nitrite reductase/ring-hydroxylating ferredoxin subunit